MARQGHQGFFNTIWGAMKFIAFWVMVLIQLPILFILPRGKLSVRYMRFFMSILIFMVGIKIRVRGKLDTRRPLMVVGNHISIFEMATFPVALGGSFFGKKDIEKWPLVGWVSKKFGVVFVDRRPAHALDVLNEVQNEMVHVDYPMFLFPEGTTTNGAYVKKFKSTLFNFVENSNLVVQPLVMNYRYRDGSPISDENMATHYAYFDNAKQDMGPYAPRERSVFAQVFHIMVIGGFMVEITLLPPPNLAGMDRKQIALVLHEIVSNKYMELKDKRYTK